MDYAANKHRASNGLDNIAKAGAACATHRPMPEANDPSIVLYDRAPRFTLFIRAAKLVTAQGEFVCIVRDVSETGVRLRLFHLPPSGEPFELHMSNGEAYPIRKIWHKDNEAGFAFAHRVQIDQFIAEDANFPKRGMRLNLTFPIQVTSSSNQCDAIVENISQQGACISCEAAYAIDQALRISCPEQEVQFGEVAAKVRWRRDDAYGIVFENTLSLEEFARLAGRLQCPHLVR